MHIAIGLTAKVALQYDGVAVSPGDYFEAKPIDAAALTYQRKAHFANRPDGYQSKVLTPRRRRTYKRRDLTPEPEG